MSSEKRREVSRQLEIFPQSARDRLLKKFPTLDVAASFNSGLWNDFYRAVLEEHSRLMLRWHRTPTDFKIKVINEHKSIYGMLKALPLDQRDTWLDLRMPETVDGWSAYDLLPKPVTLLGIEFKDDTPLIDIIKSNRLDELFAAVIGKHNELETWWQSIGADGRNFARELCARATMDLCGLLQDPNFWLIKECLDKIKKGISTKVKSYFNILDTSMNDWRFATVMLKQGILPQLMKRLDRREGWFTLRDQLCVGDVMLQFHEDGYMDSRGVVNTFPKGMPVYPINTKLVAHANLQVGDWVILDTLQRLTSVMPFKFGDKVWIPQSSLVRIVDDQAVVKG